MFFIIESIFLKRCIFAWSKCLAFVNTREPLMLMVRQLIPVFFWESEVTNWLAFTLHSCFLSLQFFCIVSKRFLVSKMWSLKWTRYCDFLVWQNFHFLPKFQWSSQVVYSSFNKITGCLLAVKANWINRRY